MKFLTILFLLPCFAFAQDDMDTYYKLATRADSLYEAKDFKNAVSGYKNAFASIGGKATEWHRMNYGESLAMTGQTDSAFVHLNKVLKTFKFSDLDYLKTNENFKPLKKDKRWKTFYSGVEANKTEREKNFDRKLISKLKTIQEEDQKYRRQMNGIAEKYGSDSPQMDSLWKIASVADSLNLIAVKEILDTRGWLGADVLDFAGNNTLFLVIQHSDHQTQLKYLPMMREAAKNGNAQPSGLALLEDRVALGEGKMQLYGSQIGRYPDQEKYYVLPLEDPDNVNKRREEMNLGPIEEYAGYWNIQWNVEEYKKELPALIELQKKQD